MQLFHHSNLSKFFLLVTTILLIIPINAQESSAACASETVAGLEIGSSVVVTCEPQCTPGSVWGTDIYTSDSDLCAAAAHAGVITLEEGGIFRIFVIQGLESYTGSEANGITSSEWPAWASSLIFEPLPLELAWGDNARSIEGETGTFLPVSCPSEGSFGSIWGTVYYTDDSSVCTAAVHTGLITAEEGGVFYISIIDGQESYTGSEQNGVTTSDWPTWERSFVLSPSLTILDWSSTGRDVLGLPNTSAVAFCPPEGTFGSIWGTDIYTDDSSVCTAAVHAGLITTNGGFFMITILDGQESYAGSEQNGVTTSDWPAWERSFSVGFATPDIEDTEATSE